MGLLSGKYVSGTFVGAMLFIIQANVFRAKMRSGPMVGPVKTFEKKSRSEVTTMGPEPAPSAPGSMVATVVPEMLLLTDSPLDPGQLRYAAATGVAVTLMSTLDTIGAPAPSVAVAVKVCAPAGSAAT